jgi:hypothetical protein
LLTASIFSAFTWMSVNAMGIHKSAIYLRHFNSVHLRG